jgi:hypothetical protein
MQNVPKIVQSRLQRPTPVEFESHPESDLLTAFAEQSLAGRERDRIVEHLARCGDCREVVSIALPPQLEPQPLAGSTSNWFRWPVVRWAAVAAGVALIASLGILQYRGQHPRQLASNAFDRNAAIVTPAQIPQASSPPTIPDVGMKKAEASKDKLAVPRARAFAESQPGRTDGKVFSPHTSSAVTIGGPIVRSRIGSGSDHDLNSIHGSAFGGSPRNVAPSAADKQNPFLAQDQRAAAVPSASQTVEVQSKTAEVATSAATQDQLQNQVQDRDPLVQNEPATQSAGPGESVAKAKPASAQASPSTLAPAPSLRTEPILMKSLVVARWTISATGALQHSLDGGKTWLDANPAGYESAASNVMRSAKAEIPPVIFRSLAVSSNATEVWAGGSGAALYHTVDGGKRWNRVVPAASGIALSGDITNIQFSDPRNGTVTTSNSEAWTTTDDGQTWHKQQ